MEVVKYHTRLRYEPNMDVKTVAIDLIFIIKKEYDRMFELNLIRRMVKTSANGYETDAEFNIELQKRLIMGYNMNIRDVGNTTLIRFTLTVPKKDLISDYNIEEAIEFFKNAIFNPFASDGKFNEERFATEKQGVRINFENSRTSVYHEADRMFMKYADPERRISRDYEYELNLLENVTAESTYEYYKECVLDNNYLLYMGGCIDEETANNIYEKHFKQEKEEFSANLDYYEFFAPTKEDYYEEKYEFNQSALFMEYRATDLEEKDIPYYSLISNILSTSENDLIFKTLRMDNNLVYASYTNRLLYNGIFYIEAYLSKNNKDKAIELVKDVFVQLRDKEFLQECIEKLKRGIKLELVRDLDYKYQSLENLINKDLHLRSLKDIYNDYENITADGVIEYFDRIKLNTILFIEGDEDDKN